MKQNLTLKQQKLVLLLKQELARQGGTKTLAELMILAGYSATTARLPSNKALNSPAVKEATTELIQELEDKAKANVQAITPAKIKNASGRDNAYIADIMVKNKQLLSGNDTERKSIIINISEEIAKKNA